MPQELKNHKFYTPKDSLKPLSLSEELVENRVAKWWSMLPWEFRVLGQEERAELHAIYEVERNIEAYYASEQCRKMDRERANSERK